MVAGFPVVDLKVTLIDGKYHDVNSSALAFEICARQCLKEALQMARPVLLEPIMKVEVVTPEDYTGSVIGDLNSRRGQIQGQDMRGNANVDQRDGAADEHVRLRQQSAVNVSGPRHIHDAIRSLLGAARERVSRSTEEIRVIGIDG